MDSEKITDGIKKFFENFEQGIREVREREDLIRSWAMETAVKTADRIGSWKPQDIINAAKAYETYFRGDAK